MWCSTQNLERRSLFSESRYFYGPHVNVILFTPIRVWPSQSRFSRISQMLNSIMLRFLKPNLIQIGDQIWRAWMKWEKIWCTLHRFSWNSVTRWSTVVLYRIVCESDENWRKYGQNVIYARQYVLHRCPVNSYCHSADVAPMSSKLVLSQRRCCTDVQ